MIAKNNKKKKMSVKKYRHINKIMDGTNDDLSDDKVLHIVLDLDQTIICATPLVPEEQDDDEKLFDIYDKKHREKALKFEFECMDQIFVIFQRPHLQDFLDFIFKNFKVSVWTAASKDYALFIIDNIIIGNNKNRDLDLVFFSYHCKASEKFGKGTKDLSLIWKLFGESEIKYNKYNSYIIDDYDHVHDIQPENCIIAPPFHFSAADSEKDLFLKELIPKLKILQDNVKNGKLLNRLHKINGK